MEVSVFMVKRGTKIIVRDLLGSKFKGEGRGEVVDYTNGSTQFGHMFRRTIIV